MRRTISKLTLLVLVLFVQLMLLPSIYNPWPHGEVLEVRYRQEERLSAYWDFRQHPTAETKAAYYVEYRRMRNYVFWVTVATLAVLAVPDWAVIHFILDRERKTGA
jgi:hypothetical protein